MESDFFDNPEITVQLSHYFGSDDPSDASYTPRGTVVIRSFKGPRFTTTQKDIAETDFAKIMVIILYKIKWNPCAVDLLKLELLINLQKLAESSGYYFLKASVKSVSGEKIFKSFASAVRLYFSLNREQNLIGLLTDTFVFGFVIPSNHCYSLDYPTS